MEITQKSFTVLNLIRFGIWNILFYGDITSRKMAYEINLLTDVVFFSSTFRDFQIARQKILLGFQNLDIKIEAMEHFDATGKTPKVECLHRLEESQVYLLVIGEMYGSIDQETGLSFTELEYDKAVELFNAKKIKDIWVFKPTSKYKPASEHMDHSKEKKEKLEKFRKKVCSSHTTQYYDNLDDLRAGIYGRCYNSLKDISSPLLLQAGIPSEGLRRQGTPDETTVKFVYEIKPLSLSVDEKEKLETQINEMNKILKAVGKDELRTDIIDVKSVTLIGNYYYTKNQFKKAIEMYDLVLKYFPNEPRALNNKGSALRGRFERKEAGNLFRKAMELDPNYTDPAVNLGGILSELGNPEEALKILDTVYKKERDTADFVLLLNLGLAHSKTGNFNLAHDFYDKAEKLAPKEILVLTNIATLYQGEKNYQKAIEYTNKILHIDSHNGNALTTKGSCYLEQNKFILGLEYLNESVKLHPDELVTLVNLCLGYRRLHDYTILKKWYADFVEIYAEKALKIKEDDFMALDHLGWVYNRCEKHNEALDLFDKALKIKPNHTGVLLDKADALLKISKYDSALKIMDHVIELDKPSYDLEVLRAKYNVLIRGKGKDDAESFVNEISKKLSTKEIQYVKKIGTSFGRINNEGAND